ncbi:hypothetical protein BTJ68_05341 [Hortaea werneckii EXF-2000]|uniref:Methyltransferase type 11 domain-containing protein n=1 Tax=Hortaea werneckii EXF-2000 TaxID=1157616 RepID=A0A1Z5TFE4_HORWE|nr:hypothetical protein BTJ68_05341 [Hortaea werneckii EXF-2000]
MHPALRQTVRPAVSSTSSPTILRSATATRRTYAISAGGSPIASVFSNDTKRLHKDRAGANQDQSRQVDYLRDEVAIRLCDRLLDINRSFPRALDFGANACKHRPHAHPAQPGSGEREEDDGSYRDTESMLFRDQADDFNKNIQLKREVLKNPEYLPYEPESFDLVMSSLSLHWINDLPSVLTQINNILKPDAPFIAAMSGGDSLYELRGSLQLAEQERLGGIGTHISPLADVRDVGNLLSRAGFRLLTVDVDDIVVDYPNTFALMSDLQAMGEANAALRREPGGLNRDVMLAAEAIYRDLYGEEQEDGTLTIPATFRTIYMIGWKEGGEQPKPLERGTGDANLTDVLGGGGRIG